MRRLIVLWLIVSLLGYGLALAADTHHADDSTAGFTLHLDAGGADHHDDSGTSAPDCDHCCHGAAHLLGLGHTLPALRPASLPPARIALVESARGFIPATPFRPPIAS